MSRNHVEVECVACHEKTWEGPKAFSSRTKPRCGACGAYLEAPAKIREALAASRDAKAIATQRPRTPLERLYRRIHGRP